MKSYVAFQTLVHRALKNAHNERALIKRIVQHPSLSSHTRGFLIRMARIEAEFLTMSMHLCTARNLPIKKRSLVIRTAMNAVKRNIPHESLARDALIKELADLVRRSRKELNAVASLAGMSRRV